MRMIDEVKALLDLSAAGARYDEVLEVLVSSVKASADEYMGVGYSPVVGAVAYIDGRSAQTVYLPHVNVSAVTVEVGGIALDSTEYVVYPEAGKVKLVSSTGLSGFAIALDVEGGGAFPTGERNVKITYSGGYAEDALPASLRRKLVKQVTYEFRRRNDPGLSSVQSPDGSVQKFDRGEWLKDVQEELDRRRRIFL